jgi:23S rRNA pseudouridine1911/1915/1917 synthase
MVVHPAPGNWTGTLVNALKGRGGPLSAGTEEGREGIVHRLDKETSGLLLVGKVRPGTSRVGSRPSGQANRSEICSSVLGTPRRRSGVSRPSGRPRPTRPKADGGRQYWTACKDGLHPARALRFRDLLEAHLFTGRTHQIRVHLASIGHPVVGDDTYGGGGGRKLVNLPPSRHFLHAAWLVFRHPVSGETVDLRSPLPETLHRALVSVAGPDVPLADLQPARLLWILPHRSLTLLASPTLLFRVGTDLYGSEVDRCTRSHSTSTDDAHSRRAGVRPRADQHARHDHHRARSRRASR